MEIGECSADQPFGPPRTGKFTWVIEKFSKVGARKLYSESFVFGDYLWRVLLSGPGFHYVDHLSLHLVIVNRQVNVVTHGWIRTVHFNLAVVNQYDTRLTIQKDTRHHFSDKKRHGGFKYFMTLAELDDSTKGFLVNDTLVVKADVVDCRAYDSKRETGFNGLKNMGATGYLNVLLQTWYHLPYFRQAVYQFSAHEDDAPNSRILTALQMVFYNIQYSNKPVSTKDLLASFGWDIYDAHMQHDVVELWRVLFEKLEPLVKEEMQWLFIGHYVKYSRAGTSADDEHFEKAVFQDLSLSMKGCENLYHSLDKYVEGNLESEWNNGDNLCGLPVLFIDFPPVLWIQLMRLEWNYAAGKTMKIQDRYEFPLQLDLDKDNGKYLHSDANRSVRNLYVLHSVIVHEGQCDFGFYHSFVNPTLSANEWYKFANSWVTKATFDDVFEEQFGGQKQVLLGRHNTPFICSRWSHAYVLVYIRESDKHKIMCNVNGDIHNHLQVIFEAQQAKKKRKAERHLFTDVKVVCDHDFAEQIGKEVFFDLVDFNKVTNLNFHIENDVPFTHVMDNISTACGIPQDCQRYWLWTKRQNHTFRPWRPFDGAEYKKPVGQLRQIAPIRPQGCYRGNYLLLYLETHFSSQSCIPYPPPENNMGASCSSPSSVICNTRNSGQERPLRMGSGSRSGMHAVLQENFVVERAPSIGADDEELPALEILIP